MGEKLAFLGTGCRRFILQGDRELVGHRPAGLASREGQSGLDLSLGACAGHVLFKTRTIRRILIRLTILNTQIMLWRGWLVNG